ncbi:branched-chain amino acid ABC transporter permease [Rhizobium sp. L1K21]|uniref:branched-chain amino acid ABC transporter permease n=1 Tax=Rhizobium sp. L1K21 TaxID=2954933 RepID=UPI002091F177|nr:branched-chain amino acid ABC transporter permease [Rhizobium sp. L1K21]MCO6188313.1 branched-chain amino acid ABC transporter permease [Rhizobium sp. L1K21]
MRIVFKTSYDADIRLFKHGAQAFWYAVLLALAIAAPFLLGSFLTGEATNVLIWAICGMGLMLLVGQSGQASLGHAAFMAIGAYSCVLLQTLAGLPFLLAFPLAGVITGIVGAIFALPVTRLHGIYLAIATIAVSIMMEDIIVLSEPITGGVNGLFAPDIEIFGLNFNRYSNPSGLYWLVLAIAVLVALVYRNMQRSPLGRSFAAVRDSEISAQAMGINVARTKALAFGLSCAITGLGGALMGYFATIFNHETFNIVISINLLLMIVIGGLGTIHGAFLGAIVIGFLPQAIAFSRDAIGEWTGIGSIVVPGLESGIFALILIGFILLEPMGMYGRWVKIRTYFELFPFARRDMFRRQKTYLKTERIR